MYISRICSLFLLLLGVTSLISQDTPIELGKVKWLRSYDLAIAQSKESEKPVFMLFQEVPGCSNCTRYGSEILSHPLIVEFIETYFVPLAIYNNKGGADKKILEQFGEPAWNNPVVRLIDESGADKVARIANFKSSYLLLNSMITVIQDIGLEIPSYVDLLEKELHANEIGKGEAYLGMYCFWTGEKEIAQIEGVVSTEAGYMHGKEVVKVTWDQAITNLETISNKASKVNCADQVFSNVKGKQVDKKIGKYRMDAEDKYYLRQSSYQYVPLTELQKSKVNSALGRKTNPKIFLSPRQLDILSNSEASISQINKSIYEAWYE